jgi:hypothetical protein
MLEDVGLGEKDAFLTSKRPLLALKVIGLLR